MLRPGTKICSGIWTDRVARTNGFCPATLFLEYEEKGQREMKEIATILLRDADSSDEAVAIVGYEENLVSLCLSLKSDGDVQVVMKKADAAKLEEALKRAISQA